jgi:hypothetical protein
LDVAARWIESAVLAAHSEEVQERNNAGLMLSYSLFLDAAYFKDGAFEEEREVRAAAHIAVNSGDCPLNFRPSALGPTPYATFDLSPNQAPSPVRCVVVGPSPDPPTAQQGVKLLLMAHGLDVPVIPSKVPLR